MELAQLNKQVAALGNPDIDFFIKQLEYLNNRTDIEIVFSGTLSNGKSTLINALLGRDLLPAQLGATTALVTTVEQGLDRIEAQLSNGEIREYPLSKESIETITEEGEAESMAVYLDDFPYTGIRFVDTPGIDDISQFREEKTINYVPLADAVVFVIDASKGLTGEEKHFFSEKIIKANKDKIFIVLNKADTVGDGTVDVDKLVPSDIAQDYKVYALSSLKYLAGVLSGDEERKEESALGYFKDDLNQYLVTLDKKKTLTTRTNRSLDSIWQLGEVQLNTLISSVSKSHPELESEVKSLQEKLQEAKEDKATLESEIDAIISKVEKCMRGEFTSFQNEIEKSLKQAENKEFKIDVFNENVPLLCEQMADNLKQCGEDAFQDVNFEFEQLDELYLNILRNIDDYMAQAVWLLSLVPKIGQSVKPFIPAIQEGVRRLVDMIGGTVIDNAVNTKVDELVNTIEESMKKSLKEYKNNLLDEYEHKKLGVLRSEIIALESTMKAKIEQKENIEHQVKYFEVEKKELEETINTLMKEVA